MIRKEVSTRVLGFMGSPNYNCQQSSVELELTLVYGHWGGIAAASHAQLCLIGWGSNQLWEESALGSWGESVCYEPDQVQRGCTIMDVQTCHAARDGKR